VRKGSGEKRRSGMIKKKEAREEKKEEREEVRIGKKKSGK
jgi:hypothetical protein